MCGARLVCALVTLVVASVPAADAAAPAPWAPRIFTVAGTGVAGSSGDCGLAARALIDAPLDLAALPDGGVLVLDQGGTRVRRVSARGRITTVAGTGAGLEAGDGGPATAAVIYATDVAALPQGGFLLGSYRSVRRVGPDGIITTVAGTGGGVDPTGDGGPATRAEIDLGDLAALPGGGFVFADPGAAGPGLVRRVGADGTVTTVAGTGAVGFSGDGGPATAARIRADAVAALPDGGLLIGGGGRVRRVAPDGTITTVAGTGAEGVAGDGGPATQARIAVAALAALPGGGFLVAGGSRVRRVDADGTITTVTGTRRIPEAPGGSDWPPAFLPFVIGDGGSARQARYSSLDVADGSLFGELAALPAGGFAFTNGARLRLVADRSARLLGLALGVPARDRAGAGGYATHVSTSRPARVTVTVWHGRARVARASADVARPGWDAVRVRGRFRPGLYAVRAGAVTRDGAAAVIPDRPVLLGGVLPDRWVRREHPGVRLLGAAPTAGAADSDARSRVVTCRRFGPRRVDCELQTTDTTGSPPYGCTFITFYVLRGDGQVYARRYACPDEDVTGRFERRPHDWWDAFWGPVDLSPPA
jgi:hypothetical protein